MHVIVLTKFNDAREGVVRNEGDIFEVAPDRYEEIMAYRADLVQVFEPEPEKNRNLILNRKQNRNQRRHRRASAKLTNRY